MGRKRKKAAAIAYAPPQPAPVVLAVGRDREAERILEAAREAGVAIVEDPGLAAMLETAKPGDYIPPWCWEAAAKILAFVAAREEALLNRT
ncbi:MAG: EscU/YscU/HrcU family type III secretion system export apparatus switch protein [Spirochaetaceae bacterium]|jgi:flagellar biosynthesis protein|nr:EscU/YscU/HrcU family type III secretion system export apparatus switch protein [Spirochaetaceae bacterium]